MNPITETQFLDQVIEFSEVLGRKVYHAHDSRKQVRSSGRHKLVGDVQTAGYPEPNITGGRETI